MRAKIEGRGFKAQLDDDGNWTSNNPGIQSLLQYEYGLDSVGPSAGDPFIAAARQAAQDLGARLVMVKEDEHMKNEPPGKVY